MIEENILNVISNYGFPIFMVLWFMFRTEKIIKSNTEATERLSDMVKTLCKRRKI